MTVMATSLATGHEMSVADVINSRAQSSPNKPFLIDPESGEITSFSNLKDKVSAVAAHITSQGVEPGASVAYAFGNSSHSAIIVLGIMYGGFLATAINLVAGDDTITYVLEHSEAKLVFVDQKNQSALARLAFGCTNPPSLITVDEKLLASLCDPNEWNPPSGNSDGLLMYTSGTTGRPKGVVLTHTNLLSGGQNAADAHQLSSQDRALCVLPLFHINGLCVTVIGPLVSGGSVVIPSRFSVSGFWHTIRHNECSWFSVVPTQISYLLHNAKDDHEDISACNHLRFGRSASAPLAPDIHEAFETRFGIPIIETMGLTETAAQILSNPLPPAERKIGSPGIATGNEIMIADENQTGLPCDTEGEVLVRGPNVMRCYLKNEEATSQAITPEGWLRTGDLGRMDEDGYVYITGRLKELIIKGGENIAPREIDEALYSHPDVIEAAAFACSCQHYGQRVEAGVALAPGSCATEAELIAICEGKVGAFKTPDRIYIMDDLPKGPSGKIQRIKLAELVLLET